MDLSNSLLSLENIHMSFRRVDVLKGIDLTINRGEVVALVGDNGAGKSTIIKVMTGVHHPTKGKVYIKGEHVNMRSVQDSRTRGVETVYQERALADQQEIWRNVFAGREIRNRLGFMDVKRQRAEAAQLLRERMGFTSRAITTDSEVAGLSGGEKQGVAIARALFFEADLIILDEPTMGLSLKETDKVLKFVRNIREQGKSAILIDHNILHVYSVADRFVILDRGKIAGQFTKDQISREQLIDIMVDLHQTGQIKTH
ncbi:Arabinose import ATP-binding protein AraG [Ruegeria sp. THAF57]|uniref:ATP-binding cassette domain-containing protein n=1 Tax=Ruegeria sp. THAF57 TaxID=2744555 RepID=UPI0015DF5673|nr:ATP-binding cassette domain-containing protein [Ruegeria sp. THAF57]CAD0186964.1 Arabinose import ATP-binding protein AraG [Ruegeria sp. THAF57]